MGSTLKTVDKETPRKIEKCTGYNWRETARERERESRREREGEREREREREESRVSKWITQSHVCTHVIERQDGFPDQRGDALIGQI